MEQGFKNIDELLRSSLGDYKKQPSPKVWKDVSGSLPTSGIIKFIIMSFSILAISFVTYLYWDYSKTVETPDNTTNIENSTNELLADQDRINMVENSNNKIIIDQVSEKDITKSIIEEEIDIAKKTTARSLDVSIDKPGIVPSFGIGNTKKGNITDINTNSNYPEIPGLLDNSPVPEMHPNYPKANSIYIDLNNLNPISSRNKFSGMPVISEPDYGKSRRLSYGFYVSPEIIFTNDEEKSRKLQVNMDAVINYKTNEDFYLQGGIGIGVSQDDGKYSVDYSQYDSIGYYYEVNSFTIDPITGKPVFKTTVENVYDTIDYNSLSLTGNRYTYFRLSGFFGYKVYDAKRFSVFIKSGLTYSILASSYEPKPSYTNDVAIGVEITNETPQRIINTWQLSAGLGLNYRISISIVLTGEPIYNYYLRPVYEQRLNAKSPYSICVKLGLLYRF